MTPIRKSATLKRNDRCSCGSGKKYKYCCIADAEPQPEFQRAVHYIDSGEEAVRWVISDSSGTKFFSDKDGRVLVFADKAAATGIAMLDDFADQEPGEINVAAVGPTKWQILQDKLPFIEVDNVDVAAALVRERIAAKTTELADAAAEDAAAETLNKDSKNE